MAKEKKKKNFWGVFFDVLIAAELVAMLNTLHVQYRDFHHVNFPYLDKIPVQTFENAYKNADKDDYPFGQKAGEKFNAAPIVLLGDSSAYGLFLSDKDKFSTQLAQAVKRPVYNKAWGGWSIQNAYWLLMNEDFYKEYKQEPKAVIFVYTPFMFRRMYAPDRAAILRYTVVDGDKLIRNPIIYNWLTISYLFEKIVDIYAVIRSESFDNAFDDFKVYLINGKKNANKHWKNTSFYILKKIGVEDNDNPEKWKELEQEGFKIIDVKDLMGENYTEVSDYFIDAKYKHPTRLFWADCVPKLINKIDL